MEEHDYMGDDLYPRDGAYYQPSEPESQVKEAQIERAKAKSAIPMLKDLTKRFARRSEQTDSVKKAHEVAKKYGTSIENALIGLDIANNEFVAETQYLESLIDQYK